MAAMGHEPLHHVFTTNGRNGPPYILCSGVRSPADHARPQSFHFTSRRLDLKFSAGAGADCDLQQPLSSMR
ncbi:hypothetical protein EVAR_100137_1 [Eumeta japonica]|uniref:Uncharacterized protein n=1 Tax=Eumeta variegata TaxID=151549 RepID=A0A4C1S913_EUMVA|nr:hypothetical protein EVAR_100137_1 [Eumeta japonica]